MDTKALRQKILDLAIRGKLVPQDPNDEPASVLLERIRAEKQQMVKDGKLKPKDIKNDTIIFVGEDNLHYEKFQDGTVKCIEDEIPFELPEGWAWSRANCISDVRDGTHDTPAYVEKGVPLITSKNLTPAGVDYSNVKYISVEDATQINQRSGVDVGDILFAMIGTIGNPKLVTENTLISIKNVALFKFSYSSDLSHHYILRVLEYLQEQMKENPSGGLQPFVSLNRLRTTLLPIAPITEQNRIVEKSENLLRKVDLINYDCDELDTLIKAVKSKILDLAIRGQLVPQDPNDEPASVLLERIRAEKEELIKAGKIKRDKKESIIFRGEDNSYYEIIDGQTELINNEIPFELPDNWEWVRLSSVMSLSSGKAIKIRQLTDDGEFPVYGGNGINGLYSEYNVDSNAIIIGRVGYYCGSVYKTDRKAWVTDNALIATIKEPNIFNIDFLVAILKYLDLGKTSVSTAQPVVSGKGILPLIVPVPPFNEQILINSTLQKVNSHVLQVESELL